MGTDINLSDTMATYHRLCKATALRFLPRPVLVIVGSTLKMWSSTAISTARCFRSISTDPPNGLRFLYIELGLVNYPPETITKINELLCQADMI